MKDQIRLDESRIRPYLHAHGYDLLRPVLTVASPDPEYESKRGKIEELQRRAQAGEIDLYYEDEIDLALLREIGERYGKSPAQVAIRWLIENENVLPIPGAKNGRQAADNAGALSFQLTSEEIDALSHATMAWRN